MGRAKLKALKETTLVTFFQQCSNLGISADFKYNSQDSTILYKPNGSIILLKDLFLYPSDPEFDSLGSLEISGAFIDECNQVVYKAWEIVKSRCRWKLDEYGIIPKILGSCNPAKNWVYSQFYTPFKKKALEPHRRFIQALPTDNEHLSPHYIKSLLRMNKASKQRLYYGNWEYDDDPASLMSIEQIHNFFTNKFVPGGEKYLSCDVARYGKDSTVIILWDGLRAAKTFQYNKKSTVWVAAEIERLENLYGVSRSNIVIDEDGVGGGVVDMLDGARGFVNNSKALNEENFNNLKSQCYYKLADLINASKMFIDLEDPQLISTLVEELEQVKQWNMDKDTTKQVMPKDKVKEVLGRSPDISDAVMMRMIFELVEELDLEDELV